MLLEIQCVGNAAAGALESDGQAEQSQSLRLCHNAPIGILLMGRDADWEDSFLRAFCTTVQFCLPSVECHLSCDMLRGLGPPRSRQGVLHVFGGKVLSLSHAMGHQAVTDPHVKPPTPSPPPNQKYPNAKEYLSLWHLCEHTCCEVASGLRLSVCMTLRLVLRPKMQYHPLKDKSMCLGNA